jgi:ABC-type molybdenum transport system ATPase subunit/photorepair protein PhrA
LKNKNQKPNLYIIGGPNGAGKTTFARKFLPQYVKCLEFVMPISLGKLLGLGSGQVNCLIELIISRKKRLISGLERQF